jgi:hypothetical protein
MVFDVVDVTFLVHPLVRVRAIPIHVSVSVRGSAVGEENGYLMESLWGVGPEVPSHVGVFEVRDWVSLLAVDKVWEFYRVLDEEYRSIVSDHIVVTLFGVELDGETSGVSLGVGRT